MKPDLGDNLFLRAIDESYRSEFGVDGAKIGAVLRIRLPTDYYALEGPAISVQDMADVPVFVSSAPPTEISGAALAVIGTAAVLAKNPTISRRFWSRS